MRSPIQHTSCTGDHQLTIQPNVNTNYFRRRFNMQTCKIPDMLLRLEIRQRLSISPVIAAPLVVTSLPAA